MNKYCYYNGKISKVDDVKINPYDLGFIRGYGIFDAMRTANGNFFCFDEHWDKFINSAKELDLNLKIDKNDFKKIVGQLFEKNNIKEGAIKTVLTGGISENGFLKGDDSTILILVDDLEKFCVNSEFYKNGWKLITLEFQRCLPELKTTNYLVPIKNQKNKKNSGAQEILYKFDNIISECSTSNIFMVKDGILITPKENVFLGTMRNLVIKIAKERNFSVKERDIRLDEIMDADEVFITATYKKIVPVVKIDENVIKDGQIGKITTNLMELVDDFIKNYS